MHERQAAEAEERGRREGRAAGFHDEKAAEHEQRLDRAARFAVLEARRPEVTRLRD
jgi:hypothetical protein